MAILSGLRLPSSDTTIAVKPKPKLKPRCGRSSPKNDFMLPDKDAELPDVFVHSITPIKSVCDVNSGGGKLQAGDLPEF